jgi:methyl-accepting chemotaxis protein
MLQMKFFKTFRGKITLVIGLVVLLFISFSSVVFYENSQIKENFYYHSRHHEPTMTLTFVAQMGLGGALINIQSSYINKDTVKSHADFNQNLNNARAIADSLEWHCKRLGIEEYRQYFKNIVSSIDNFRQVGTDFLQINGGTGKVQQTMYEGRIMPTDSAILYSYRKCNDAYWKCVGAYFEGFGIYSGKKEERMALLARSTERIVNMIILTSILIILISFAAWFRLTNYLKISMQNLRASIENIAKGKLNKQNIKENDEVGEILIATNTLSDNLQEASEFATEIGKGNFEKEYFPASEEDRLGHALLSMRDDLSKFKKEDLQRMWVNQGYAKFSEIIRSNDTNLSQLTGVFLQELVKYLDANQGTIFIVDENEKGEVVLNQIACYAYGKNKIAKQQFYPGEGLVGQCFDENDILYLTDIPEDHIKITSGLGEALPNAVLICPIRVDRKVFGVIEIASFKEIQPYQKEFVDKVGESFASVLLSVRNNEKNKILLEQLQEKTEMMRSQEEEMRQNMEELQATQEEMLRKESEYLKQIERLTTKI